MRILSFQSVYICGYPDYAFAIQRNMDKFTLTSVSVQKHLLQLKEPRFNRVEEFQYQPANQVAIFFSFPTATAKITEPVQLTQVHVNLCLTNTVYLSAQSIKAVWLVEAEDIILGLDWIEFLILFCLLFYSFIVFGCSVLGEAKCQYYWADRITGLNTNDQTTGLASSSSVWQVSIKQHVLVVTLAKVSFLEAMKSQDHSCLTNNGLHKTRSNDVLILLMPTLDT